MLLNLRQHQKLLNLDSKLLDIKKDICFSLFGFNQFFVFFKVLV